MDTVQLLNWLGEFEDIMTSGLPKELRNDRIDALWASMTEQPDMWDEEPEQETERML